MASVQGRAAEKISFLEDDFYDSLRWLFVGALTWEAASTTAAVRHQAVLGMYTAAVQARSLYEFFYGSVRHDDDARAVDLVGSAWVPSETDLYATYMASHRPANKRMFHLVLGREQHSGGADDGSDHLKNQVMNFATDLLALARDFVNALDPNLRPAAQSALDRALLEASVTADACGIVNSIV